MTASNTARKPRPRQASPSPAVSPGFLSDLVAIAENLGISQPVAVMLAHELQREWGGDRPYIIPPGGKSRSESAAMANQIRRDIQRGESVALLARRYGISARRVQQIAAKPMP